MNEALVVVENLSYKIGGKEVLTDLNFRVAHGKIIALLGENGAGKTTLLKLLASIRKTKPEEILIQGQKIGEKTRKDVSFLDDLRSFSQSSKLKEILRFYAQMYEDFDKERSEQLMHFMQLSLNSKLNALSTGNLEKFRLVCALSRKAKLYLLDEPLAGVDILSREKIVQSIVHWFDEESTMIISSHHVQEIENITDEVLLLHEGRLVAHRSIESIREEETSGIESYYRKLLSD